MRLMRAPPPDRLVNQRGPPEAAMAKTGAPVPSAEDVAKAFTNLDPGRLRDLFSSFVDNVLASGSPRFDLKSMLVSVPQGTYFVLISKTHPACYIINPPSRTNLTFAVIGLILMLGSM